MAFHARPMAKLNLTLAVDPRGEDAYHPLRSVMLRIGLADELTVEQTTEPVPGPMLDRLTVSGLPGCPVEGNLVLRAFELVRRALPGGHDLPPLAAHLDKRIALAAGLGGGSSDGAAALEIALAAWGVGLAAEQLAELALELGSDVPFFASGAALAVVEGRGEQVRPQPAPSTQFALLLVTAPIALSTAAVFARFDDMASADATPPHEVDFAALARGSDGLHDANDLWPAAVALAPSLDGLRGRLEGLSGRPWQLSGSGPTLFAVYPSAESAADGGRELVAAGSAELDGAIVNAVDLDGPDPSWRYP